MEECIGFGNTVDDHFAGEVPMARMFGIGLSHVEAFDVGGITPQFFLEKGESRSRVDGLDNNWTNAMVINSCPGYRRMGPTYPKSSLSLTLNKLV